jgi:hypothetical protein
VNTKPRQQPAGRAFSTHYTLTASDAVMLTPNVAQQAARQQRAHLVGVAGVVQHHQDALLGQQAAIQSGAGVEIDRYAFGSDA